MSEIIYEEFKGHPIMKIVLWKSADGKKVDSLMFGIKKAQAILEHIAEIEEFVVEHTEVTK